MSWETFDNVDVVSLYESLSDDIAGDTARHGTFRKIVHAVLLYHILPGSFDVASLRGNSTFATSLANVSGSLNDEPIRVRVSKSIPFSVALNFYTRVVRPSIPAGQGIHDVPRLVCWRY